MCIQSIGCTQTRRTSERWHENPALKFGQGQASQSLFLELQLLGQKGGSEERAHVALVRISSRPSPNDVILGCHTASSTQGTDLGCWMNLLRTVCEALTSMHTTLILATNLCIMKIHLRTALLLVLPVVFCVQGTAHARVLAIQQAKNE